MRIRIFLTLFVWAMLLSAQTVFAAGTCQDWKGVWDFTYDNGTTPTSFCFDNTSVIDNATIVACDNDLIENCTCIENISTTAKQLCIDDVTFAQCDNDLIEHCVCVINPVYKKLTVAKGTYEVKITEVLEGAAASAGPITNTCMAIGKRGTQDITIMAPDNNTLNSSLYKKYYPNVAKGSYVVQEGAGQALSNIHQCPQTRILPANFLSDNFTAENPYWNIPGLTKGEWVRDLTCEELNNCPAITSISPDIATYDASGGIGFVHVTSSDNYNIWSALSNDEWLAVVSDAYATGSASVVYAVEKNISSSRTGTMTIAGHTFTVNQEGVASTSTTTTAQVTTTIPTTTTTTRTDQPTNKWCPATKILGQGNPKLEYLRDFRDSKLVQSAVGRRIIQIYYTNADSINAALERSPALRAVARRVLEVIAPMVGDEE